jgi:hypothetical protein
VIEYLHSTTGRTSPYQSVVGWLFLDLRVDEEIETQTGSYKPLLASPSVLRK